MPAALPQWQVWACLSTMTTIFWLAGVLPNCIFELLGSGAPGGVVLLFHGAGGEGLWDLRMRRAVVDATAASRSIGRKKLTMRQLLKMSACLKI